MKPFFNRIGSKRDIVDKLIQLIPEHKIYVEPFVGGGAVFFFIETKNKKVIINDIDKQLIEGYKLLKNNGDNKLYIPPTIEEKQMLVDKKAINDNERLTQILLLSCNTFGSHKRDKLYKNTAHTQKIKKINEYSNKLKNVTILNEDFKKVIKKYDTKDTFFFLDPPYENSNSNRLYDDNFIDYEEFVSILSNIKGFFMLTLNDSPNIRKLFKNFNIIPIFVKQKAKKGIGIHDRQELIIMNYEF